MKLSSKALKELKRYFPRDWAAVLRERIIEKHQSTFSTNYIRYVLDGEDHRHNDLIVQEAYEYYLELKDQVETAEAEILKSA
ncbi:MAG: hypothetical protein D4R67_12045 [Bacteroidetes bacterium]|nr:MAG: hypothetical protein D4R67_12045 [Bacteroidota bacterium]